MTMNADLQRERSAGGASSFSMERLTNLLDGGKDRTERRRRFQRIVERDPTGIFDNANNAYLHRTERHVRSLAKHVRMVELCRILGIGNDYDGEIVRDPDFPLLIQVLADDFPTSLHWVMFVPNILSLCDEQQQQQWLPLCRDWKMIGCYAQTELGHGSNIRALETTATFVKEEEDGGMKGGCWIINSPSITSAKFWPGTLGKTANHAMVIARLIDGDGVDRGIHNFLVPLRSMKDHTLLPGVTTGDIGPKIGYNAMDNGYALFDHVKIPRRNMAMRFAYVDERGKYRKNTVSEAAEKVAYITMMQVRAYICNEASKNLAIACTIAIRYSAVRRQGFDQDNSHTSSSGQQHREVQILDYKQQQHRLFPLLASSYCFYFTGRKLLQKLAAIETKLIAQTTTASKSSDNDDDVAVFSRTEMQDIHASSSALKSFTTTVAADGMEDCRKACGGHGFLQCSGLPELITTYLQNPTVEGDNQMLPQQVVKVLLKLVHAVQKNDTKALSKYDESCDAYELIPSVRSILANEKEACRAQSEDDLTDLRKTLVPAFRHRAARLLAEVAAQIRRFVHRDGKTQQRAWNDSLVLMSRVSRAYSQFLLLKNFVDGIDDEMRNGTIATAEARVLQDMARLFALYWMERELGDFLEDGYLSPGTNQTEWVHACVLRLLDTIRPNAVRLVDAWDFPDFKLKSALGRYDGDVYPAIMAAANRDPLNRIDPGHGYEEHLKRLIVDGVGAYNKNNNHNMTGTSSRL